MSIEDAVEKTTTPIPGLNPIYPDEERTLEDPESRTNTLDQEGSALSAELLLAKNNVSKENLCGVCNKNEAKYKCTRCYLPYCSIVCSTLHKATHPAIEPISTPKPDPVVAVDINRRVPQLGTFAAAGYKGPFERLGESQELRTLFEQYPNLQSQLNEIDEATLRPLNKHDDNQDELSARHGRPKQRSQRPWSQDQGVQFGVQALSKARHVFGKDGEGVREFSRLVLQVVSGDSFIDIRAQIQKELADENTRIVSQLLNEDR